MDGGGQDPPSVKADLQHPKKSFKKPIATKSS